MRSIYNLQKYLGLILLGLAAVSSSSILQAAESDWVTLIDGTEGMENFDIVGDANWSAEYNAIQATEGSGASWLVSKNSYSDFTLRVEFWASEDSNSGIYMRCENPQQITDRNCYEANVYDQRPDPSFGTGAIVHIAPVDEPRPTAGGKWNVFVITLDGNHLVVELNGKRTVDVRDDLLSSGPIALQWGRGALRFRKVVIREL
jgi:3-keto-disaccharide hydrolase